MDLQRRISRLLAIAGTALLFSGVMAGALVGDAGATSQAKPDHPADHPGTTATTADATTSSTRKKSKSSTTTTTERTTGKRAAATTSTSAPPTPTTIAPTTTTAPPATTTTRASSAGAEAPGQEAPSQGGGQSQGGQGQEASAAQVGPTTSTVNAPVSRGPNSQVAPPPGQPPAASVTSSTVSNPIPPAPVANPLPRTPVTALSGPPPNPLRLEGVEAAPVGPPVPPWETQTTTPESESSGQSAGAAENPTRRRASQLGMTGSATRTLLFLAGVALLLGAVAVALGEPGPLRTAHATASAKPKTRTRRLRRTIRGWESGVPLAPTRRAAKRARLERRGRLSLPGDGPAI